MAPKIDILTIFPEAITPYLASSIIGKACEKGVLDIHAHQLRDWTHDKHHSVDDSPYGGGPGMIMRVEPFDEAIAALSVSSKPRVIMTSASGKPFTQADAVRLSKESHLVFLCGRYEGIDARVEEQLCDESFSIGPYVLTGGELPALVMIDAIVRHVPGVLGDSASLERESHTTPDELEYPQYTKPPVYKGWEVPPVLLSGNHALIEAWKQEQMKQKKNQ